MGKKAVAELVEDDIVIEKLKEIGVDYAQGFGIADELGNGLQLHDFRNLGDSRDHRPRDTVVLYVVNETAVDLQRIDRQAFEITERGIPGPEVVNSQ